MIRSPLAIDLELPLGRLESLQRLAFEDHQFAHGIGLEFLNRSKAPPEPTKSCVDMLRESAGEVQESSRCVPAVAVQSAGPQRGKAVRDCGLILDIPVLPEVHRHRGTDEHCDLAQMKTQDFADIIGRGVRSWMMFGLFCAVASERIFPLQTPLSHLI